MRGRGLIILVFALVLGGVAVFLARNYLEAQNKSPVAEKPAMALTTVVIARSTLHYGNRLEREHVREISWPAAAVPPGTFKTTCESSTLVVATASQPSNLPAASRSG